MVKARYKDDEENTRHFVLQTYFYDMSMRIVMRCGSGGMYVWCISFLHRMDLVIKLHENTEFLKSC